MKVTLINHSDTLGGASVVTFRLMEALRAAGVDARMLVASKSSSSPYVEQAASRLRTRLPFLAEHLRIFARNGFSRKTLFKISIATDGLPVASHPMVREADAVVLNWVNQGMLSLDEAARIARMKPTLWTMHDMWNITSVCHHAGRCDRYMTHCGDCPLLGRAAGPRDLSYSCFDRKKRLYDSAPFTFVAVSRWLEEAARRSALPVGRRLAMIPNAFPVESLARPAGMSRESLGLPAAGRLILFVAARIDDPVKNLPLAVEGLNMLADADGLRDVTAVFVGACRDAHALDGLRLPYVHLGPVADAARMQAIMALGDAVLSTSHYESFGATLLEGQAAGAVPVALVHDGRADIITSADCGCAISEPTAAAVARALKRALEEPPTRAAMRAAAERYSYAAVADKYINLINNLL